ncbi:MAG: cytidine deaminase, partial [Actinomycetia bacterium]|nr:cytidine deaminase [Actinomycetes bacterium]
MIEFTNIENEMINKAKEVAKNARIHLSGFAVGAAILSDSGNIYTGCNVEFDNYSNTIHAEEAAISAFVSAGEKRMVSAVIYTFTDKIRYPCGMCLQSLFELGGNDLKVIACNEKT